MKIYEDSALTLVIKSEQGEKQYFSVLFLTGNTKRVPVRLNLLRISGVRISVIVCVV